MNSKTVFAMWFFGLALCVTCLWLSPGMARADSSLEADSLSAVLEQLQVLDALVDQAEQAADTSQRVAFNYAALRADVKTMELGVQQYVAGMRDAPRRIEPLGGEYRR